MKLIFLILSLLLASCATAPTDKELLDKIGDFKLPFESNGDTVDVYIYWKKYSGSNEIGDVAYTLDKDTKFFGKLFYGEYLHFKTTPGKHIVRWRGMGINNKKPHYQELEINLKRNTTYFYSQIHSIMPNRYSKSGLSVISKLYLSKPIMGKYKLSISKISSISETCLNKREVSMLNSLCI